MALQIRRGNTADRMSITPVVGELIWDTTLNALYIGNGSTSGGIPAGSLVTEDVQDIVASMITGGTHDYVSFSYNDTLGKINSTLDLTMYTGTINAEGFIGSVYDEGSGLLINAVTGAINLNGTVKGNVVPDVNEAYDLGSASRRFRDLYLSGSSIKLGSATITASGSAVNLPAGSTIDGELIGITGGMDYNINIIGDDSTAIVNANARTVTASGGFFGNLSGGLGSDLNVNGYSIVSSSSITLTPTSGNIVLNGAITHPSSLNISPAGFTTFGNNTTGVDSNIYMVRNTYSAAVTQGFTFAQHHNTVDAVGFNFYRTRGTGASPAVVSSGDDLVDINFIGWDGLAETEGASISAIVDGSVSSGNIPTKIVFRTNNGSSTGIRASIDASGLFRTNSIRGLTQTLLVSGDLDGDVTGSIFSNSSSRIIDGESGAITSPSATLSQFLQLPVYADDAARSSSIPTPAKGMVILMVAGSSPAASNTLQFFDGSSWVNL